MRQGLPSGVVGDGVRAEQRGEGVACGLRLAVGGRHHQHGALTQIGKQGKERGGHGSEHQGGLMTLTSGYMQPEMTSCACHITGGYKPAGWVADKISYIRMTCRYPVFDRHPREGGDPVPLLVVPISVAFSLTRESHWVPAFAGMTTKKRNGDRKR